MKIEQIKTKLTGLKKYLKTPNLKEYKTKLTSLKKHLKFPTTLKDFLEKPEKKETEVVLEQEEPIEQPLEEFKPELEHLEKPKPKYLKKPKLKHLKKPTLISIIGIGLITTGLAFSLNKYFQLKQNLQKYTQVLEENKQLRSQIQEHEQFEKEHIKSLDELTKEYDKTLTQNAQLNRKYTQALEERKQSNQEYEQLNKKHDALIKEHETTRQKNIESNEKYAQALKETKQSEQRLIQLKQKYEPPKKTQKQNQRLEIITSNSYSSGYGFPDYKPGALNKQFNWDSNDVLDNKGWQVVNKKTKETLNPREYNLLCFKPASDFNNFSSEDNYATFHLHANKPIDSFIMSAEYNIQKNGYIDIFLSQDNKNWIFFQHFENKGEEDYRFAWGHAPYYSSQLGLNLYKDIYIRHSAGAKSKNDYLVEIWRVSFAVN